MFGRLIAVLLIALFVAAPSMAQNNFVTYRALTPKLALKLAQITLAACQKQGYQVAVAIVDRSGTLQVLLRDRFAGAHTPETARRKAWTAVSFRTDTLELVDVAKAGGEGFGLNFVSGALALGGGVRIQAGGANVGGVGVSGAPGGKADEDCAKKGLASIDDELNF